MNRTPVLTPSRLRRSSPLPMGEGGARRASVGRVRSLTLFALALALTACIATQAPSAITPTAPGFLEGVWHGFIFPVAFIVSLFTDDIAVYAVPNNGVWYDAGYFVGICFLGVGARHSKRRS